MDYLKNYGLNDEQIKDVEDAIKDCRNALPNLRVVITAHTSTDAILESILINGNIIAKSQKIQRSIFKAVEGVHFLCIL